LFKFARQNSNFMSVVLYSKFHRLILLLSVIMFLQFCSFRTFADTVVWDFTALTAQPTTSTNTNIPLVGCTAAIGNSFGIVSTPINSTSASNTYTGFTAGGNIGNAVAVAGNSTFNSGTSPYISFVLTPSAGYTIAVNGMSFGSRSTGTGPQAYTISTSVGGFGTGIVTGVFLANSVWALANPTFTTVTGTAGAPIEVRIYGYGGAGSPSSGTENWRIDDIIFTVTVTAAGGGADYYSGPTGNLDDVNSWWTGTGGTSGTHPTDFTSASQVFHISNGTAGTIGGSSWIVSGGGSKIIVDGTDFTIPSAKTVSATIDVNAGRTLTLQNPTLPTLGALNATSTVKYSGITFTSGFVVPSAATYGNIVFDNTTVVNTATTQTLIFAGNFTLQNLSSFIGSDVTANGYNLTTTGTANQTISGNGLPFHVRGLNNNNTVVKTGALSLAANTNMTIWNSLIVNCAGVANQFSDGGNSLTIYNNVSLGGDALGYNLTGTIIPSLASGTVKFRGFVGGAANDAAPVAAALNNININTSGTGGVSFLPSSGSAITIKGNLIITTSGSGNVTLNSNTIQIGGNLTHTPTSNVLTATGSTLQFNGTGSQIYSSLVPAGNTLVNVLMTNTGAGLTLNAPLNISGLLTLTNGKVNTGANILSLTATGAVSGGSGSSYVNGNFLKTMPSGGTSSMAYETGDVTYSPVVVTFSSSVSSGSVTVKSTYGSHPQIGSSFINLSNFVNRSWTITSTGVSPATVNIALSYNSGDMTGTPNTNYTMRQYSGAAWSTDPAITNTTSATAPLLANATTSTGANGSSFSGDYVAGQLNCPAAITGPSSVCVGSTITLSDATSGGTWSSSNGAIATVGSTGIVTGTGFGAVTISYTLGSGCASTTSVTVNPLPNAISGGATPVCVGSTVSLSDAGGGTWTSSNGAIATVGSGTGTVSGIAPGNVTITYTLGTGCSASTTISVNPLPVGITGSNNVCVGSTINLSDASIGGTWSSTNGAVSTVGSTGIVTGVDAGTVAISYTLGTGCATAYSITVNPLPSAISGSSSVCVGATTSLTDVGGGTWATSNGNSSIGSSSGVVTGIGAGTSIIIYTLPTGCVTTAPITINPLPSAIAGLSNVCEAGSTITLTDVGGGSWTSSNSNAAIDLTTGIVTGVTAGSTIITYTLSTGCTITKAITVNPLPSAISGIASVCAGSTRTLTDGGGGTWSSSNSNASIGSMTGIVTGINAGNSTITYTLPTGCITTTGFTVNPLASSISGTSVFCQNTIVTLSNTDPGGTWTSSNTLLATVGSSTGDATGVSVGSPVITYTLPTGCIATKTLTVNASPNISNFTSPTATTVCLNSMSVVTVYSTSLGAGTFTVTYDLSGANIATGNSATLTMGTSNGTFTTSNLAFSGSTTVTITSITNSLGCTTPVASINSATLTVNPLPSSISGSASVCRGYTTTLSDGGGGIWSSGNPAVASIGSISGVVMGNSVGNADITYTLPGGCAISTVVTVNPLPYPVTGAATVCQASSISLNDATPMGSWSSSDAGLAIVGTTGVVTGVSAGIPYITYTLPTGCYMVKSITVNPLPMTPATITGASSVCVSISTTLSNVTPGGSWSSSNPGVAIVNPAGVVTGVSAGAATISYTETTVCGSVSATKILTINPLPVAASIFGTSHVCIGSTTNLTDATAGGLWSTTTGMASISPGGVVTGVSTGVDTIKYTVTTGCGTASTAMTMTVNPLADAGTIAGLSSVCVGETITLSDPVAGGFWLSNPLATVIGGAVTGVAAGSDTVKYGVTNICGTVYATKVIAVNATPNAGTITGASNVCQGTTITLSDAISGGTWTSSNAAASISGTGVVTGIHAGTDTIRYMLGGACAVFGAATKVVVVNTLPSAFSVNGGGNFCLGSGGVSIELSGSEAGAYYQLYNGTVPVGGHVSGTGTDLDLGIYTDTGTYTVVAWDAATSCTQAMPGSANVAIVRIILPDVSVTATPGTELAVGQPVTFTAVVTNGVSAHSYQWFLNHTPLANDTTAMFLYNGMMFYDNDSITCVVHGAGPCGDMSGSRTIVLSIHDVGVNQINPGNADIRVVPNPNNGEFTISGKSGSATDENVNIELSDMTGRVVYRDEVKTQVGMINKQILLKNNLAKGIYILNVRSATLNGVFHVVIDK
jgi:trimeric autotransporter adhesin